MNDFPYIADFHSHFHARPFLQIPPQPVWGNLEVDGSDMLIKKWIFSPANKAREKLALFSQGNLDKCRESNLRLIFVVLCPVERPFFKFHALLRFILTLQEQAGIATFLSGIPIQKTRAYLSEIRNNKPIKYFDELKLEYEFVIRQSRESDGQLVFVSNYQEAKEALADPNKIVCILTIEGLHGLINFPSFQSLWTKPRIMNSPQHQLYWFFFEQFRSNIEMIKAGRIGNQRMVTPFFITFTHHFWNLLCGHAPSIKSWALNQKFGQNQKLTHLGKEVLSLLLSRKNGRRILIDIKHMSPEARGDFFQILRDEYRSKGDVVPVIASHTCVSGISSLQKCMAKKDNSRKNKSSYFDRWSINLTDEDIKEIFNSGGIIGLNLNGERIGGKIAMQQIAKSESKNCFELIAANLLHIVQVCNNKKAWNIITIGTDFDGFIAPLPPYQDASKVPVLLQDLRDFFDNPYRIPETNFTREKIVQLLAGHSGSEIISMIAYRNTQAFLEKYFTDAYLSEHVQ